MELFSIRIQRTFQLVSTLHIEEKKRLADFCASEKSKNCIIHRETDKCSP